MRCRKTPTTGNTAEARRLPCHCLQNVRTRASSVAHNDNDFSIRYSGVVQGLAKPPDQTVIDGEVIALDEDGRPSFSVLQNYGSSKAPLRVVVRNNIVRAESSRSLNVAARMAGIQDSEQSVNNLLPNPG
jgi:ATP-dependent DNA ligase